jgi:hypothetical protein
MKINDIFENSEISGLQLSTINLNDSFYDLSNNKTISAPMFIVKGKNLYIYNGVTHQGYNYADTSGQDEIYLKKDDFKNYKAVVIKNRNEQYKLEKLFKFTNA